MARVNRTTGFFLVLGVAILLGSVAGTAIMQQGGESPSGVTKAGENSIHASGNVDVESGLAPLVPSVPGKVMAVLAKEGQAVKKGQPLVQLDDQRQREELKIAEQALQVSRANLRDAKDAAEKKVKEYELALERAQAEFDAAQVQYKTAYDDYKRAEKYEREGTDAGAKVLAERLERAAQLANVQREGARKVLEKLKSMNPQASLAGPEEALKEGELKVKAAQDLLDAYVIKAPSDGEVFEINYQVGGSAPLAPSDPNTSRALVFCPSEALIVRAEIDQEWAFQVKAGMKVTLTYQAAGSQDFTWTGKVERVSRYIQRRRSRTMDPDTFNDSRTRECIIRIDPDSKDPIIHGMRMRVQIHTKVD